jgi:hypothetical protein
MWHRPPEGNAMHPFLYYDYARERQREILAESEKIALAQSARSSSDDAWMLPAAFVSVVLVLMVVSTWTLLS